MKLITIAFSLLSTAVAVAETEIKGTPAELATYLSGLPKLVSVIGESEVKIPADRAEVTLKVSTENKSLQEALRLNREVRGRVAAVLKESGLVPDQIQGAKFSSTQKYGWFNEKAKSHRVDNFLKVIVRDEHEFQAVASTVDRWTEVHFLGIDVQHSNKAALKAKAQAQACDNASERRKIFEDRLGVKLTPKRFVETTTPDPIEKRAYRAYDANFSASKRALGVGALQDVAADAIEESASPFGELVFTARVMVEYTVESK